MGPTRIRIRIPKHTLGRCKSTPESRSRQSGQEGQTCNESGAKGWDAEANSSAKRRAMLANEPPTSEICKGRDMHLGPKHFTSTQHFMLVMYSLCL